MMGAQDQKQLRANRAAEYVRMSTDDQKYSIDNQRVAIRLYADLHGLEIVCTYADEGKSGLQLQGRSGLQAFLRTIQAGDPPFATLIVYDVSRLGRFQDTDEGAHYEYLCKLAGVRIEYCAEPFSNDGTPLSAVLKSLKRAMAAEYSRELSEKVYVGQCRLIELGFRQGGRPGMGLRRLLIDQFGKSKGLLQLGEQKSIQTDRVVLVLGPPEELALIREIFRLFVFEKAGERLIADKLNREKILTDRGRMWLPQTVHCILTNEKYIGNNVFGRTSGKLLRRRTRCSRSSWTNKENAFEAIVNRATFWRAQEIIKERAQRSDPTKMLIALKALYARRGTLSTTLINNEPAMERASTYKSRFGSLTEAYRQVGFSHKRDSSFVAENRHLRVMVADLFKEVSAYLEDTGSSVEAIGPNGIFINQEVRLALKLIRPRRFHGSVRWVGEIDSSESSDLTLILRMHPKEDVDRDFFLLPGELFGHSTLRLRSINCALLEAFRFDTLDSLCDLGRRQQLRR